jgi:hypothetical protein
MSEQKYTYILGVFETASTMSSWYLSSLWIQKEWQNELEECVHANQYCNMYIWHIYEKKKNLRWETEERNLLIGEVCYLLFLRFNTESEKAQLQQS